MSDLATIEDRLRRTYQAVADSTVVTDDELPDPTTLHLVDRRDRPAAGGRDFELVELADHRATGRRRFLLTAAATVGVAALGAAAIVAGGGTDDPTAQTGGTFASGWTPIAEAPIESRYAHSMVWTGEEMVVFGGYHDDSLSGEPAAGAAAYDPATDAWREIAEPPEALRGQNVAVWTGEEVVAFPQPFIGAEGGEIIYPDEEVPGATYDPETDTWREIPVSGIGLLTEASQVFWTGDRVLVIGIEAPTGTLALHRVGMYDPATDTWERIDDIPVSAVTDAAWTGEELVYVGPSDEQSGQWPDRMVAVALDPDAGTWRELPEPPLSVRFAAAVEWTGSEVVVVGGNREEELHDGATFDLATETWQPLPDAPTVPFPGGDLLNDGRAGATGQLVFLDVYDSENGPLVLDLATRTWSRGQAYPGEATAPAVSTGSMVLTWGGTDTNDRPVGEGYAYVP